MEEFVLTISQMPEDPLVMEMLLEEGFGIGMNTVYFLDNKTIRQSEILSLLRKGKTRR